MIPKIAPTMQWVVESGMCKIDPQMIQIAVENWAQYAITKSSLTTFLPIVSMTL